MDSMIAVCGLDCQECPALKATRADDDDLRKKVAETWSKEFHADIKAADINCAGCTSTGQVLFHHCNVCEIRACGIKKGVVNCAHCPEYACDTLKKFFTMVPFVQKTLDEIRSSLPA